MSNQTVTRDVSTTLSANTFTRSGYYFAGWATSSSGSVVYADKASVKNLASAGGSITLYAVWKAVVTTYTIKFSSNGGSGSMSNQTVTRDVSTTLSANAFTRSGYDFSGWATSSSGSVVYADKASVKNLASAGGSITLYAVWKAVPTSLPNLMFYQFSGWQSSMFMTGAEDSTVVKTSFTQGDDMYLRYGYGNAGTVDASCAETVALYYDGTLLQSFTETTSLQSYYVRSKYLQLNSENMTAGTHTFRIVLNPDKTLAESDYTDNEKSVTFTVIGGTYTVKFNANGGSGSMSDFTATCDVSTVLPANAFTRSGYTFSGWATSSSGSVVYADEASVKNLASAGGSITLYAVWKAVPTSLPNLSFYTPTGWADSMFVGTSQTATQKASSFTVGDVVYVRYAIRNSGTVSAGQSEKFSVYFDGVLADTFAIEQVLSSGSGYEGYLELSNVKLGTHTVKIVFNPDREIAESDYTDNEKSVTFVVSSTVTTVDRTVIATDAAGSVEQVETFPTAGSYVFGTSTMPSWVTGVQAHVVSGSSNLTLTGNNLNLDLKAGATATMTFTLAANTTGASRSWTYTITGPDRIVNIKVTQAGSGDAYSVTYDYAGGTKGSTNPSTGLYNGWLSVSNPTRSGYTFLGWKVTSGLSTGTAKYKDGGSSTWTDVTSTSQTCGGRSHYMTFTKLSTSGSVKLTAQWIANTSTYTVAYDYAGGTKGATNPSSYKFGGWLAVSNPTRSGYTFLGWKVTSGLNTLMAQYRDGNSGSWINVTSASQTCGGRSHYMTFTKLSTSGAVKLTAQWIANTSTYTVTYDYAGGTKGATNPSSYRFGGWLAVSNPTRSGYTFLGWKVTSGLNTRTAQYRDGNSGSWVNVTSTSQTCGGRSHYMTFTKLSTSGSVKLTAQWIANTSTYTVTYDYAGGTKGATNPSSYRFGGWLAVSNPTRSGYTFLGWKVTSGLNTRTAQYRDGNSGSWVNVTSASQTCGGSSHYMTFTKLSTSGSVKLTAQWTAVKKASQACDSTSSSVKSARSTTYSGALADGSGTFSLYLDAVSADGSTDAYLIVYGDGWVWSAECEALLVDGVDGEIVLTHEDGTCLLQQKDGEYMLQQQMP